MYNLIYVGHRVTLPWLDLRENFDLDLSRSNYTWFDAPWRDKHYGIKIVALPLKLKTVTSKNRFGKFWNFDPWWPQFWPEPKNDRDDFEMIFRELSNAVFRFVLRCAGAEIDGGGGGCSNTPQQVVENRGAKTCQLANQSMCQRRRLKLGKRDNFGSHKLQRKVSHFQLKNIH